MGELVYLNCITKLDVPAERVIQAALEAGLTDVAISGVLQDGSEYFASSVADGADCLWMLERMKKRLLEITDEIVDGKA